MRYLLVGFVCMLVLLLSCINGNFWLFDAVPFGGWAMLLFWVALHLCGLVKSLSVSASESECRIPIYFALAYAGICVLLSVQNLFYSGESLLGFLVPCSLLAVFAVNLALGNRGWDPGKVFGALITSRLWTPIWVSGFLLSVLGSKSFDLLGGDFFTGGFRLLIFNASRLLFAVYLGFSLHELGAMISRLLSRPGGDLKTADESFSIEQAVLRLFSGASAATIGMFLLGLVGGFYFFLLFPLMFLLVWKSSFSAARALLTIPLQWSRLKALRNASQYFPLLLAVVMVGLGLVLTIIVKGFWPGGAGGDVYTHYLPYYREVISSHGLYPNDVWYHYYVSKGAGLLFLSMILSNELGGQMVTLVFQVASAAMVFLISCRLCRSTTIATIGAGIFLLVFIPALHWGIFLKHHEMLLAWTLFGVWLAVEVNRNNALTATRELIVAGSAFGLSFALQFPTATALIIPFFGVTALVLLLQRQFQAAFAFIISAGATGFSTLALIAWNIHATGLGMETPIRLFWKYADRAKFSEWVSPYLMTYLEEGSSADIGAVTSPLARLTDIERFASLFRLEELRYLLFSPALLVSIGILIIAEWMILETKKSVRQKTLTLLGFDPKRLHILFLLFVFAALAWVMANIVNQPVSIHRMFTFLIPVSIMTGIFVWSGIIRLIRTRVFVEPQIRRLIVVTFTIALACYATSGMLTSVRQWVHPMIGFSMGLQSAGTALQTEVNGRPGTEVWKPYLAARKSIGNNAKILCFNIDGEKIGTSFAFPGPGMESEVSFALGPEWHVMAFGSPDVSKAALQKAGINFFLADVENQWLFGGVPFSSLFAPANISEYLGMVQSIDGTWLMTWKEKAARPLNKNEILTWEILRSGLTAVSTQAGLRDTLIESITGIPCDREHAEELSRKLVPTLQASIKASPEVVAILSANLTEALEKFLRKVGSQSESMTPEIVSALFLQEIDSNAVDFLDLQFGWTATAKAAGKKTDMFPVDRLRSQQSGIGQMTLRMLDLSDVVRQIYEANGGSLLNIQRPEGLRHAKGWQ
jgi:hypothetical protein